jgi:hypothetical protein
METKEEGNIHDTNAATMQRFPSGKSAKNYKIKHVNMLN